ncbi:sensor histidine kinase [Streptomyces sp. NBC_00091]|uniref:sensor histidine kinase n=1 Tax=Streptomyces sp. NBC_00091 TaxID=2975648 RepID=UPI00224D9C9D|nr:histidine kinase [Streptomyces sp. NBC_00091]MCX5377030.1 histidine kinase [Streptomyces sp. NBC_00091]
MSKLTGWWKDRSSAGKVELYTRWSFHTFVAIEAFMILLGLAPTGGGTVAAWLALPLLAQIALCGVVSSRTLDWVVGTRAERPVWLMVAMLAVTAGTSVAVMALRASGTVTDDSFAPTLVINLVGFATGSLTLGLPKVRHMALVTPCATVFTVGAGLAVGLHVAVAVAYGIGVVFAGLLMALACGFSAWLLRIVHELDRARDLQAQLAVAEERLRFGRDLHDVMGRNLAVIALKSELAVQLARRERPEAVDQMIEVQRIARESQREVRDVVRGYREADLAVELEGARGVLSAAGMDCRVEFATAARTLPGEVQSALGWVVREATTNVLRHGDARSCLIRLTAQRPSGTVTLLVENDGVPEAPAGPPGSGLAGLRERLAAVDGTLLAGPAGGGRFRLRAEVPLDTRRTEVRA